MSEDKTTLARFQSARGGITLVQHAPDVLETVLTGHLDTECFEKMIGALDAAVNDLDSFVLAVDGWEMTSYDTAFRSLCTHWLLRRRKQIAGELPMSVQSQLIIMGVQVINLAIGGIVKIHKDRNQYRDFLTQLVAKRRKASAR